MHSNRKTVPYLIYLNLPSIEFWDLNLELASLPFGYRAYPVPALPLSTTVKDSEFDKATGDRERKTFLQNVNHISPLGYLISSFTPLPVSGEAELWLITRTRSLPVCEAKGLFGRNQLSPISIDFSPLVPGHPSDLNLSKGSEPPSCFRRTLLCPGLDRPVSGLTPVTWALSHPVP